MNLRVAQSSDRAAIERIARASFDRVYAFFAIRGARRSPILLVAEEAEASILGFLEGRLFPGAPSIGYVYFVATDPSARQRGVGRALVEEALRLFRERGATRAFAAVPENNEASMVLFTSLEFERIPRKAMRRWYGLRGVGVLMRMLLAPHETLLARTFTDPSPASADEVPRS